MTFDDPLSLSTVPAVDVARPSVFPDTEPLTLLELDEAFASGAVAVLATSSALHEHIELTQAVRLLEHGNDALMLLARERRDGRVWLSTLRAALVLIVSTGERCQRAEHIAQFEDVADPVGQAIVSLDLHHVRAMRQAVMQ